MEAQAWQFAHSVGDIVGNAPQVVELVCSTGRPPPNAVFVLQALSSDSSGWSIPTHWQDVVASVINGHVQR
jgi:hypothetical protein